MAVCSDKLTRAEQDPARAQFVMVSCHCKEVTPCKLPKCSICACLLLRPRKCWIQLCGKQLCPLLQTSHGGWPPLQDMCITQEWKHRSELSPSSCSVTYSKRLRHKGLNSDPFFVPRHLMTSQGWGGSAPYLLPQGARLRRHLPSCWCASLPLLRAWLHLHYSSSCNGSNRQGKVQLEMNEAATVRSP